MKTAVENLFSCVIPSSDDADDFRSFVVQNDSSDLLIVVGKADDTALLNQIDVLLKRRIEVGFHDQRVGIEVFSGQLPDFFVNEIKIGLIRVDRKIGIVLRVKDIFDPDGRSEPVLGFVDDAVVEHAFQHDVFSFGTAFRIRKRVIITRRFD